MVAQSTCRPGTGRSVCNLSNKKRFKIIASVPETSNQFEISNFSRVFQHIFPHIHTHIDHSKRVENSSEYMVFCSFILQQSKHIFIWKKLSKINWVAGCDFFCVFWNIFSKFDWLFLWKWWLSPRESPVITRNVISDNSTQPVVENAFYARVFFITNSHLTHWKCFLQSHSFKNLPMPAIFKFNLQLSSEFFVSPFLCLSLTKFCSNANLLPAFSWNLRIHRENRKKFEKSWLSLLGCPSQ